MSVNRWDLGQAVSYIETQGGGILVREASSHHGGGGGGTGGGGTGTPSPTLELAPNSNLEFNLIWDSSVGTMGANQQAFMTAVENVAYYYSSLFTETSYAAAKGPLEVINIHVGWGEVNGQGLPGNALGASETNGYLTNWGTVTGHLPGYSFNATNEGQVQGAQFFISSAEAKGFGLILPNSTSTDGYIGFGSGVNWYFGDSSSTGQIIGGTAGQYLLGSVAQHEISEVMGRIEMEGTSTFNGQKTFTPLDLFNFSAGSWNGIAATLALGSGASGGPSYFSHNNGQTVDGWFNDGTLGGDIADWASASYPGQSGTGLTGGLQDAFDAFGYPNGYAASSGTVTGSDLSQADYLVMETLGVSPTGVAIA